MSNEELKEVVNASGWARVNYELGKEKEIEKVVKRLDELQTIPAIDEILDRLNNTESSYKNFEKLKERINHYENERKKYSKYYEIYDEKIKREKYKYNTMEDCLKIIRSAEIQIINDNHFGLSLTHYEANWSSEKMDMTKNVLGWDLDEDEFTEEQQYKWNQIENNLPEVLRKLINGELPNN